MNSPMITKVGSLPVTDDRQLILEAKQGSHHAFRLLVEKYMRRAYNVAYAFANDHHLAEDITQEAFVRVFRSLSSFRGDAEFGTWLYRIVTNVSLNRLKSRNRRAGRELSLHEVGGTVFETGGVSPHTQDVRFHIERALHELPTLQRSVVILRHIDGLSTQQVSDILRCSEGTVKTHLFRGLKKLRRRLYYLKDEST